MKLPLVTIARIAVMTPVKHRIIEQGAVFVNDGYVHHQADGIVAICFDLQSKRAEYGGTTGGENTPIIMLDANEYTTKIDEAKKHETTFLELPEYSGWEVFLGSVSRYTLRLVLIDERP